MGGGDAARNFPRIVCVYTSASAAQRARIWATFPDAALMPLPSLYPALTQVVRVGAGRIVVTWALWYTIADLSGRAPCVLPVPSRRHHPGLFTAATTGAGCPQNVRPRGSVVRIYPSLFND